MYKKTILSTTLFFSPLFAMDLAKEVPTGSIQTEPGAVAFIESILQKKFSDIQADTGSLNQAATHHVTSILRAHYCLLPAPIHKTTDSHCTIISATYMNALFVLFTTVDKAVCYWSTLATDSKVLRQ